MVNIERLKKLLKRILRFDIFVFKDKLNWRQMKNLSPLFFRSHIKYRIVYEWFV